MNVSDIADESLDEDNAKAIIEQIKRDSLKQLEESEKHNERTEDHNVSSTDIFYQGDDAKGFFISAGETYIYPTNYPIRDYQRNIVHSCLFENTLVSLPTGLGKTFIAAVVMFNFYRWYPRGKIVFMAPTRPLVSQQMRACYDIMGIPVEDTIELLGTTNVSVRKREWLEKRVFYVTPQTIDNDLRNGVFHPEYLKCLVIDEAHRATKNYAYCQVVQQLRDANVKFRVVALSATPGREIQDVINLIRKLNIAKLELRSENSIDIVPYTHAKKIDSVEVPLSDLVLRVREEFLKIIDRYTRSLKQNKVLQGNTGTLTKFLVMLAKDRYVRTKAQFPHINRDLDKMIQRDFHVTHSLASALENLTIYGLRSFYNNLLEVSKEDGSCPLLGKDNDLQELLQQLKPKLDINIISNDYAWSHLKFIRLREIVETHFRTHSERGETTKVIIFANYRVVVAEIADVLKPLEPMVKASMFVGQSSGVTQQEQKDIMKKFRDGEFNTLIATSVGEEGLDIGEIDLVICFDSQKSPIKLVQRLGRTGRKRNGRCVFLLTQGREAHNFRTGMQTCKSYVEKIINNKSIYTNLTQNGPRMIPLHVTPTMRCLHIVVKDRITPSKPSKKKAKEIEKPKGKSRRKQDNSEPSIRTSKANTKKNKNQPMSQTNDIRTCFENLSKKKKTYIDFITQSSGEPVIGLEEDEDVVIVQDQRNEFEALFVKLETWADKCVANEELILDDHFFSLMENFWINDADQTPVDLMDVDQMLETEDRIINDINEEHRICESSNTMTTPMKIGTQQHSKSPNFSDTFHMDLNVFSPYDTNVSAQQNRETSGQAHRSPQKFSVKKNHCHTRMPEMEAFESEILNDGNDDMFLNFNSLVPSHLDFPIKNGGVNTIPKDPEVHESRDGFTFDSNIQTNETIKGKETNVHIEVLKETRPNTAGRQIEINMPEIKQLETSVYQSVDELFASDEDVTSPVEQNNDIRSYFVSEAEVRDGASYVEPMSVSDLFEDSPNDEDYVENENRNSDQLCDERGINQEYIRTSNNGKNNGKFDEQSHIPEINNQNQFNEIVGIYSKYNQQQNQNPLAVSIVTATKTPGRNDFHQMINTQDWPCSSTPVISGHAQKKLSNLKDREKEILKNLPATPDESGSCPFTPKQKVSHYFLSPDVSEIKSQVVKPSVKINLQSKFNSATINKTNGLFAPSKSQNKSKSLSYEIIFDSDSDETNKPESNKTDNDVTNLDGSNMFTVTQLVDMACERERKVEQTTYTNNSKVNDSNLLLTSSNKENLIGKPTSRKLDGMEIVDCSDEELIQDVQSSQTNDKSLIESYITTRHLAQQKPFLPPTKSVLTKLSFVEENEANKEQMDVKPLAKKQTVHDSSDEDLEFFIPKRNPRKNPAHIPKSPLLLSKTKSRTKVTLQRPSQNTVHFKSQKLSNLSLNDSEEEVELLRSLAKASDLGHVSNSKHFDDGRKPSASYTKSYSKYELTSTGTSTQAFPPSQKQTVFNLPSIPKPYTSKSIPKTLLGTAKSNSLETEQHIAKPSQSTIQTPNTNLEKEFGGMTDVQFEEWLKTMNESSLKTTDSEPVTSPYFAAKSSGTNAHQKVIANRANLNKPNECGARQSVPTKSTLTNREKDEFERAQRGNISLLSISKSSSSTHSIQCISSEEDDDLYFFKTTGKLESRTTESLTRPANRQANKIHQRSTNHKHTPLNPSSISRAKPSVRAHNNAAKKKKASKKKAANPYIEVEADVSLMEGQRMSSDDDLTNSSEDEMDSSFIDDEQDKDHTMAVYLKSVRSPQNVAKFKIPTLSDAVLNMDVYSQAVAPDRTEYLNDSFCVEDEEEETEESVEDNEISLLEMAERRLERERQMKKRAREKPEKIKPRRRVIQMISSSDED